MKNTEKFCTHINYESVQQMQCLAFSNCCVFSLLHFMNEWSDVCVRLRSYDRAIIFTLFTLAVFIYFSQLNLWRQTAYKQLTNYCFQSIFSFWSVESAIGLAGWRIYFKILYHPKKLNDSILLLSNIWLLESRWVELIITNQYYRRVCFCLLMKLRQF